MTPAAQNGIHAICTAHSAAPKAPNKAMSMISIRLTPSTEWRSYTLRSIQSLGVPWP